MEQLKEAVIDEVHYIKPNQSIRLEYPNIVPGSFVCNAPLVVNYKEGKVCSTHPAYYALDEDGKFEVVVSYLYYLD